MGLLSGWTPRTLYPRGGDPALGALFLEGVAGALGRRAAGEGLLVEGLWGEPFPAVTPLGRRLDAAVGDVARRLGVALDAGLPEAPPARGDGPVAFGLVVPRAPGPAAPRDGPAGAPPGGPARPAIPVSGAPGRVAGTEYQAHWFARAPGRLGVHLRLRLAGPTPASLEALDEVATDLGIAADLAGAPAEVEGPLSPTRARRREWDDGSLSRFRAAGALEVAAASAARLLPVRLPGSFPSEAELHEHVVVLGASGGGKTALLAEAAARRIADGLSVIVVDVHGDLAPAIAALLPPSARGRLIAVDAGDPAGRVAGLALLGGRGDDGADLVAALRRLAADGGDVYWGFRIERVLESFVRLAAEEGGTLADVAELLTDARRREAARRTTAVPALARFLDDLGPILRRNPEFLWPAAARVARILLSPRLRALLAPGDGGLPLGALLAEGRSVLWRIPSPLLGPEAAGFAATLLLTRAYLTLSRSPPGDGALSCLLVVDEAQAVSPRLLTEILAEGRKFGLGLLLASQYPERLHPELRAAAAGSAGAHVLFRVPPAAAAMSGTWAGLPPAAALEVLPTLPRGVALVHASARPGGPRLLRVGARAPPAAGPWEEAVERTAREHGVEPVETAERSAGRSEALLLPLFAAGAEGRSVPARELLARAAASGPESDPAPLLEEVGVLLRRGWVRADGEAYAITPAGERALGVGGPTGAPSESAEHRALLLETVRLFARRGERLDILAQGRFDARLPDAFLPALPRGARALPPRDLEALLHQRRAAWAWRFFGGRDVHVEAEVSGALRPDRIRRGLEKAARAGAFALFVVADPLRARRVRSVLVDRGAFPRSAQVWTLPRARRAALPGDARQA